MYSNRLRSARPHPLLRLIFFVPLIILLLAAPDSLGGLAAWQWVADLVAGLTLWTLLEYVMHRFVFHYVPRSRRLRDLQLHLDHHARPSDLHLSVTPLTVSVPVSVLVWGGLVLATGSLEHATVVSVGAILGYIGYALIHFCTHQSSHAGRLVRYWRSYHFEHHEHPRICYGVTSPLWDLVFRTSRRRRIARTAVNSAEAWGH